MSQIQDSDDDEVSIVNTRKKKTSRFVEESDEESADVSSAIILDKDVPSNDAEDNDDKIDDDVEHDTSKRRRRVARQSSSDDDDDNDNDDNDGVDQNGGENENGGENAENNMEVEDETANKENIDKTNVPELRSDLFDAEMNSDNEESTKEKSPPKSVKMKLKELAKKKRVLAEVKSRNSREINDGNTSEKSSDSESSSGSDNSRSDNGSTSDDDDNDNGNDDTDRSQLSAALQRRLSKGAAKKESSAKRKSVKPSTSSLQDLHSETQRLVRESHVKIPYYEPPKVELSQFLARTQQKQQQLVASRVIASRVTPGQKSLPSKPLWRQSPALSLPSTPLVPLSGPKDTTVDSTFRDRIEKRLENEKRSENNENSDDELPQIRLESLLCEEETNKVSNNVQDYNSDSSSKEISNNIQVLNNDDSKNCDEPSESVIRNPEKSDSGRKDFVDDFDDLPDLVVEISDKNSSENKQQTDECDVEKSDVPSPLKNISCSSKLTNSEMSEVCSSNKTIASDLENNKVSEIVGNLNCDNKLSPYKDTNNLLHDANSGAQSDEGKQVLVSCKSKDKMEQQQLPTSDESSKITEPNTVPDKLACGLNPKMALCRLTSSTAPRLSCTRDEFIDLDEDEEKEIEEINPGVRVLMERLVRHSITKPPPKQRHLEISTVTKERIEEGKEELKVDKLTYTLEEEEENDPSLAKPGARLLQLRENLRKKMKARREEALQKRYEIFALDREEGGFGGEGEGLEEEEEAELTDPSDDDDDDEEEEVEEEEEDIDEEEAMCDDDDDDDDDEKKNPFADDEAEDDDDDDDEYSNHSNASKISSLSNNSKTVKEKKKRKLKQKNKLSKDNSNNGKTFTGLKHSSSGEESEADRNSKQRGRESDSDDSLHLHLDTQGVEEGEGLNMSDKEKGEGLEVIDWSDKRSSVKPSDDTMSLHLYLDTQDVPDDLPTATSRKTRKLNRNNTLEIYNEDANTESPKTSQNSNPENKVTDRAFEKLFSQTFPSSVAESSSMVTDILEVSSLDFLTDNMEDTNTNNTNCTSKDNCTSAADLSFDLIGSLIPAGQRQRITTPLSDRMTPDLFATSSISSTTLTSVATSKEGDTPVSEMCRTPLITDELAALSPPVSCGAQPLLNSSSTPVASSSSSARPSFFHLEDSRITRDLDWLLDSRRGLDESTKSSGRDDDLSIKSVTGLRALNSPTAGESDFDELLGLCSGKFSNNKSSTDNRKHETVSKSLFSQITQSQSASDELIGLCSGQFMGQGSSGQLSGQGSAGKHLGLYEDSQGEDSLRHILSGTFSSQKDSEKKNSKKRKVLSDDERIDDDDDDSFEIGSRAEDEWFNDDQAMKSGQSDDEGSQDSGKSDQPLKFTGFTVGKKSGKIREEFVEDEAELSGSDVGSDDDVDDDDELEEEEGDKDDVGSEEFLRNQVHRVHLKSLIDADKREIRLLQEHYLADGDLHNEGGGRMRRFRWSNIDDEDDDDGGRHSGSDDNNDDDEGENEAKWRTERLEREKFLQEQKENDIEMTDSQLIKLGQTVFKQQPLEGSGQRSPAVFNTKVPPALMRSVSETGAKAVTSAASDSNSQFKIPMKVGHGSFLQRSKESIAKIVELSKPLMNPSGPQKGSRGFLFTASEEKSNPTSATTPKPAPHAINVGEASRGRTPPSLKKPRLDRRNTVPPTSIFTLLE